MRPVSKFIRQTGSHFLRRLLAVLAVLALLVGQAAVVNAALCEGGGAVEICAGSGKALLQSEDGAGLDDRAHCDFCVARTTGAAAALPGAITLVPFSGFLPVQFNPVLADFRPASAQFWASNRGPPEASEENYMTLLNIVKDQFGPTSYMGATPWL